MTKVLETYFFDWAENLIGSKIKIEKDSHGDEGIVYRIETEKGNYFLKIKIDSISFDEYDRLKWYQGKISVPRVVGFVTQDGSSALLLSALEGKNLALLSKEWPIEKVVDRLVDVLHAFHAVNTEGWPFDKPDSSKVLIHGDACFPNFIFNGDSFSGYIDLGESKLGTPEDDLAAAVWSLQYNLGAGHGVKLLERYGYKNVTEGEVEILRLKYENYQRAHGFL